MEPPTKCMVAELPSPAIDPNIHILYPVLDSLESGKSCVVHHTKSNISMDELKMYQYWGKSMVHNCCSPLNNIDKCCYK